MAAQAYEQYEELPLMQRLALDIAPGTGHAIAGYETPMYAGETKEAIEEGNIPKALGQGVMTGLSALGMIPGLGLGIRGVKAGVKAATKGLRKFDFNYEVSGPAYMYPGEGRKIVDRDPGRLSIEARNLDEAKKLFNIEKKHTNAYNRIDKEWAGRWFTPQGNPAQPRVTIHEIIEGDTPVYISKSRAARTKKHDAIMRDSELDKSLQENLQQYEEGLLFPHEFENKRAALLKQAQEIRKLTKNEEAILKNFEATKIIDNSLDHLPISKIEDTIKVNQKQVRVPEVKKAAQQLSDNEITKVDYDKIVKEYQPIQAITEMPTVPSLKRMEAALKKNQIETGIVGKGEGATIDPKIFNGEEIAIRLDIPSYENSDTWIVTLHDGTGKGTAKGYAQSAVLKGDIKFNSQEKTAHNIARGKQIKDKQTGKLEPQSKSTIARISGTYEDVPVEDVYRRMEVELGNPDSEWVQVGMNPFRHSYFYAKEGDKVGTPIIKDTELIQLCPLVLAKNPIYGKASDFKFKQGGSIVERNPNTYNMRAI